MSERIGATFENGVFRPNAPVHLPNGQRVSLDVEPVNPDMDDLADVWDLLDHEFMEPCRQYQGPAASL